MLARLCRQIVSMLKAGCGCAHGCSVLRNSAELPAASTSHCGCKLCDCLMENSCSGFVFFQLGEGSSVITSMNRCQMFWRGSRGALRNVSGPATRSHHVWGQIPCPETLGEGSGSLCASLQPPAGAQLTADVVLRKRQ